MLQEIKEISFFIFLQIAKNKIGHFINPFHISALGAEQRNLW